MKKIKGIDREYSCVSIPEQLYLSERGIRYDFVKTLDGVTTFKYKKSAKLFECLSKYYKNIGILE